MLPESELRSKFTADEEAAAREADGDVVEEGAATEATTDAPDSAKEEPDSAKEEPDSS